MAKGDSKRARTAIESQRGLQLGQQQEIRDVFVPRLNEDRAADVNTRSEIESRYQNFDPKYNVADLMSSMGSGGGGGGGGIDPSHISSFGTDPYAGYKKMSEGLSPEFRTEFDKYMGNLANASDRYRGFADTGGFSDSDISNIRARSLAPTNSIYSSAKDQLGLMQARSGMNTGAYGGNLRKLTRDAAMAAGENAINTEAGIAEKVQAGKQFGVQGLERTSQAQVQARTQVEQLDQQMRAAGLGGMTEIEKTRLEAELQNAAINTSAASAGAARALAQAQMQLNADITANNQRLGALQGWTNLYGTAPGATGQSADDLLALQNLSQSGNLGLIGQQINASQIPSDYSQALGNIGGTLGLVGQVGSMIAGFPSFKNKGIGGGGYYSPGGYGYGTENLYDQAGY